MAQIMLSSGKCSYGPGIRVHYRAAESPMQRTPPFTGAYFQTGCALIQQVVGDAILTGPIVLNSSIPDLEIVTEPESVEVTYIGLDGEEIEETPGSGVPFYVSIPATSETTLVQLYAVASSCAERMRGTAVAAAATSTELASAIEQMNIYAGFQPNPELIDLPSDNPLADCEAVYDLLSFYINPKPVACSTPCNCIDATVKGEAAADTFTVPCCHCWEND